MFGQRIYIRITDLRRSAAVGEGAYHRKRQDYFDSDRMLSSELTTAHAGEVRRWPDRFFETGHYLFRASARERRT